jgi:P-type E1-E2 ATPase
MIALLYRLLADKILVRKLLGIETAGAMSILFADKTGTMTKGHFEPVMFLTGYFQTYKYVASHIVQAGLIFILTFGIPGL